ncbi:family 1 glycosylhydrolase [Sphingobium sp. Cam5-1]|uniref:family 1 glycosylhydrolase n=1 Tax=Sphingobium sp. Cam5-1 TaxID=2789327 RepID=UPI0018AD1CCF|nr:family 1 glycosylhydrolase [Sphingobium sp. Cam5-1]QPI74624.1 glycoside hydrolase family 1 protein [Sphingobium sp. Cam5-1]
MIDRRTLIATGAALAASPALAAADKLSSRHFPQGFLWGASTAGHQGEGNNVASDQWLLENIKPTIYSTPSGDAANSFALWPQDMDLAKGMGLNSYRFSLEWARIEPEPGLFSIAMLDHYKRMIEGARERGLNPVVTFNHFTAPRWFGAMGGWTNSEGIQLFARFCDRAARHLAGGISYAITFNEPNILLVLRAIVLPPQVLEAQKAMLAEAARRMGTPKFTALNAANIDDLDAMQANLVPAHKAAKAAIKAVRSDLPVGLSLSMFDDQAIGRNSLRDAKRRELYGAWLDTARADDFLGVQNYERNMWSDKGKLPPPKGAQLNYSGAEVYAPSLAGAVRYAYEATGVPIFVTEHGVGTDDDSIRARLIPAALAELQKTIASGVPVIGYSHWSLLDNFEWIFGYRPKFGLYSVDPATFTRIPKPSATVYGAIARNNAI